MQFQDTNEEDTDENLDFRALQDGFVSILDSIIVEVANLAIYL